MQNQSLLIRGGRLIRNRDDALQPFVADLLVRDGRIAEIIAGDSPARANAGPADIVIDGRDKLVVPGLVNAHYHSHDVLARGMFEDLPLEVWIALAIPLGRKITDREIRLRTLIGAAECLLCGITTVQDMVGIGPGAEQQVETICKAYKDIGIRCVLGLQVGNRSALDCLPGLRRNLPSSLVPLLDPPQAPANSIVDFVSAALRRPTQERFGWAIAPGAPQRCTLGLLEGLAALSHSHNLPVVTHVNETKLQVILGREMLVAHDKSWISYLKAAGLLNRRLCIAHGVWLDDREVERIAEAEAGVVTNPTSNLKLKAGIAPLRKLKRAGVRLGIGCDNVSAGDAQNLFQAMKLICAISAAKGPDVAGITAADAFDSATRGGAHLLNLDREIGTIEVGKAADLTLLDLTDPAYLPLTHPVRQIVFSECGRGVHTVVVAGEIVVEDRRLKSLDWTSLRAEAMEIAGSYIKDLRDHAARMSPVISFIERTAREAGSLPLEFNRSISADDMPQAV